MWKFAKGAKYALKKNQENWVEIRKTFKTHKILGDGSWGTNFLSE